MYSVHIIYRLFVSVSVCLLFSLSLALLVTYIQCIRFVLVAAAIHRASFLFDSLCYYSKQPVNDSFGLRGNVELFYCVLSLLLVRLLILSFVFFLFFYGASFLCCDVAAFLLLCTAECTVRFFSAFPPRFVHFPLFFLFSAFRFRFRFSLLRSSFVYFRSHAIGCRSNEETMRVGEPLRLRDIKC